MSTENDGLDLPAAPGGVAATTVQPALVGEVLVPLPDDALAPSSMATRSPTQIAWSRLRKDKPAIAGGVFIVLMVLAAIFAPLISKAFGVSPQALFSDLLGETGLPLGHLGGVSLDHPLGVDPGAGRDLFSRILYGARVSLGVSLAATLLATSLGVLFGSLAGFFPGVVDQVVSRFMDLLLAFPGLLFIIALISIVPEGFPRPLLLILVLGGLSWAYIGRLIRTLVLSLREREFVDAARVAGAGELRIMFREVIPNITGPLLTYATLLIPGFIVAEAGLSFLGVGVKPPTPSWGEMLADASNWYTVDPFYLCVPGFALFFTVFAFNLLGDGVNAAFNPKSRK